jgi:hypothetical protein
VEGEADRVVGGGVAGVQRGDQVDLRGQRGRINGVLDAQVEEGHAGEAQPAGQIARVVYQFRAGLDAVDVAVVPALEEQVVEDEAEVGLARAMVGQGQGAVDGDQLGEQWLDEMEQVIDLLQLAPAVLVELAVAGQDVQFLEQFKRLSGPDFGDRRQICPEVDGDWTCILALQVLLRPLWRLYETLPKAREGQAVG